MILKWEMEAKVTIVLNFAKFGIFGGGEIPDTCGENDLLKQGGQSLVSLKL